MKNYATYLVVGFLFLAWGAVDAAPFTVVQEGQPQATIVLGQQSTDLEQHAAEELVKYVEQMTGGTLPIVQTAPANLEEAGIAAGRPLIVLGRAETNQLIAQLCASGQVRLSPDYPGGEGFIIYTASTRCWSASARSVSSAMRKGCPSVAISSSRRWILLSVPSTSSA